MAISLGELSSNRIESIYLVDLLRQILSDICKAGRSRSFELCGGAFAA